MPFKIANFNFSRATGGTRQAQQPRAESSNNAQSKLTLISTKQALKAIYKGSVIGTGALLYVTGSVGNESLKTALYLPAAVISVPTYALGRYSAASVRSAMTQLTGQKIDAEDLVELNHQSGINTAFTFTIIPFSMGLTLDLTTMAISTIFDELCYSGKKVLCYGLELGEESKDLKDVGDIRFLSKTKRLISRLQKSAKREEYSIQLLKIINPKKKIFCGDL